MSWIKILVMPGSAHSVCVHWSGTEIWDGLPKYVHTKDWISARLNVSWAITKTWLLLNKEGVSLEINKEEKTFVMWGKSPRRTLLWHQLHPHCATMGHPLGGDSAPAWPCTLLCSLFGRRQMGSLTSPWGAAAESLAPSLQQIIL